MRIQKPKRGRQQASARLAKEIARAVRREARRYDVSKSFVIATALAHAFGIDTENYRDR